MPDPVFTPSEIARIALSTQQQARILDVAPFDRRTYMIRGDDHMWRGLDEEMALRAPRPRTTPHGDVFDAPPPPPLAQPAAWIVDAARSNEQMLALARRFDDAVDARTFTPPDPPPPAAPAELPPGLADARRACGLTPD